jgi:hypothetical protein
MPDPQMNNYMHLMKKQSAGSLQQVDLHKRFVSQVDGQGAIMSVQNVKTNNRAFNQSGNSFHQTLDTINEVGNKNRVKSAH